MEELTQVQGLLSDISPEVAIGMGVVGLTMATMSIIKKYIPARFKPLLVITLSTVYGISLSAVAYGNWKIGLMSGIIAGSSSMGIHDTYDLTIKNKSQT